MRAEEHVNDHRAAFRQYRGSNGANITLPETLLPPATGTWWERIKQRWFHWEPLTVAGRVIEKGWVVPQPLGIALLVVILGGVGSLYWRIVDKQNAQDVTVNSKLQEQRDLLIRLDQRLMDKQSVDDKVERERKEKDDLQDLQIKQVNDKLLVLNAKGR